MWSVRASTATVTTASVDTGTAPPRDTARGAVADTGTEVCRDNALEPWSYLRYYVWISLFERKICSWKI